VARCLEVAHPAPAERCNCGIYASADLGTLREHGLCLTPDVGIVLGRVRLGGRVLDDGQALRGETAVPLSLSIVAETVPPERIEAATAALAAYGVPVDVVVIDQAVAGASAAMLRFQVMSARASGTRDDGAPPRP